MKASRLQYFITLAQIEHYTKAAKVLGVSQPTLSHNIAMLEEEIGVELFEKTGRNVVLTTCGKHFLKTAQQSLDILEEGVHKVKSLSDDVKGQIDIGHMYIQGAHFLPSFIKGYCDNYSDMIPVFHLNHDLSENIIEGIQKDIYDIGFCFKGSGAFDVEFVPVFKDDLVVIVPHGHELTAKSSVTISDIVQYPQVFYNKKSHLYKVMHEYYRGIEKYPKIVCTVDEAGAMIGMVSQNFGIGIAPKSALKDEYGVVEIPIDKVGTSRTIYMAYAKNKYLSPAVKRFIAYVNTNIEVPKES